MKTRLVRAAAPLALLSLMLTACGGSALSGGAHPQEPLPSTADGTMEALDRAESELRVALGGPPNAAPTASSYAQAPGVPGEVKAAAPPAPPPPTVQAESTSRDERPVSVGAGPTASSSDPCANACRALASMERATSHLCSLAGDADARCEGARARVKNAGARVHAECPACSGG